VSSLALAPPGSPRHDGGTAAAQASEVTPQPPGAAAPARAVTRQPPGAAAPARPVTTSLSDELGGEPTLDEVLTGVWEGLAAHRTMPCPACGETMRPAYGVHARPIAGRCDGCQASLS
jgi:hypothetical protein